MSERFCILAFMSCLLYLNANTAEQFEQLLPNQEPLVNFTSYIERRQGDDDFDGVLVSSVCLNARLNLNFPRVHFGLASVPIVL